MSNDDREALRRALEVLSLIARHEAGHRAYADKSVQEIYDGMKPEPPREPASAALTRVKDQAREQIATLWSSGPFTSLLLLRDSAGQLGAKGACIMLVPKERAEGVLGLPVADRAMLFGVTYPDRSPIDMYNVR